MKKILSSSLAAALLLLSFDVFAGDSVAVMTFDGAKPQGMREHVVDALKKDGFEVIEAEDAPLTDDSAYAEYAKSKEVKAIVLANTSFNNSGWVITMRVRNGADGTEVGMKQLKGSWEKGLKGNIDKNGASTLSPLIALTAMPVIAAAEPEPAPVEEEAPAEEAPAEEAPAEEAPAEESASDDSSRPSPFRISVGGGLVVRDYWYNQPDTGSLLPQSGSHVVIRLDGEIYPLAFFMDGVAANIGIVGDFKSSLGSGTAAGTTTYGTQLMVWDVGLRGRIPFGTHEVGLLGTYGVHSFSIADETVSPSGIVPDINLSQLRLGADGRFNFGALEIGALAVYKMGLDGGGTAINQMAGSSWFPNAAASGFEGMIRFDYFIAEKYGIGIQGDFNGYGYAMNSSVGDDPAAGGAYDYYWGAYLNLSYRLPGTN